MGKVTLIGAGPGDPDLITVKGLRAIEEADVILYDALAAPELLQAASHTCEKIYVGRRAGKSSFSQDQINLMMVQHAFEGKNVARLKGGDPFVFGRGSEEIEYIEAFDIEVEVIPGISSCIAAPASQGIALTKRGVSESFWVVTATTTGNRLARDLSLAVQSSATVVILMGLNKVDQICTLYKQLGKGHLPAAIVANATKENERAVFGQIADLAAISRQHQICTPATIIIGETVLTNSTAITKLIPSELLRT